MTTTWLALTASAALAVLGGAELLRSRARRSACATRLAVAADGWATGVRWRRRVARSRPLRLLGDRLAAAGIDRAPVPVAAAAAGGTAALGAAVAVAVSPLLAILAVVGAAVGLRAWLARRVDQRREQLIAQLPDLARLLSNAAGAGLALAAGLELAARELAEPAGAELRLVVQALAVGYPLEDALGELAHRLPSREVSVLVTTLVVQHRSGGRIITALRNVATTLEDRKEVRREVRTQMAGAVASSYLVAVLGLGSVVLLNLITPGVLEALSSTPAGQAVVLVSAVLYLAGFAAIRRLTRIEA